MRNISHRRHGYMTIRLQHALYNPINIELLT